MRNRFALSALLACLLFLTPIPAAGQWTRVDAGSVRREATAPPPDMLRENPLSASPLVSAAAERVTALPVSPSRPISRLEIEGEDVRKRLTPYVLISALAGGVIGYAVEGASRPCDRERYIACPLRPYGYVVMGAAGGVAAGTLVGYLRERGQRRPPPIPSR